MPRFSTYINALLAAIVACLPLTLSAQEAFDELLPLKGFSVTIDAGGTYAGKYHANFYNGDSATNPNTIERILHSEAYGNAIWNSLMNQGLINSHEIPTYKNLDIAEYANMHYAITYQIGIGFRYDFEGNNTAVFARFNYSKLTAKGAFNLYRHPSTTILTNEDQYISCGIWGTESRTYIDLGFSKSIPFNPMFHLVADVGFNINHVRVLSNDVEIGGETYSILDVWGGQYPMMNSQSYEYYQTGIGYGVFAAPCLRLLLPHSMAADLGVNCYYNKINLPNYNKFAPQFTLFLRFILNNL